MGIVVVSLGTQYATAREAAQRVVPRMAHKMAHAHRDLVLQKTNVGDRPRFPSHQPPDRPHLADGLRIVRDRKNRNAAVFESRYGRHWRYALEYGASPHKIRPRRPGGWLRFMGRDGKVRYAKEVNHPGFKARKVVSKAARKVLREAHYIVRDELRVFVQEVNKA